MAAYKRRLENKNNVLGMIKISLFIMWKATFSFTVIGMSQYSIKAVFLKKL